MKGLQRQTNVEGDVTSHVDPCLHRLFTQGFVACGVVDKVAINVPVVPNVVVTFESVKKKKKTKKKKKKTRFFLNKEK